MRRKADVDTAERALIIAKLQRGDGFGTIARDHEMAQQ